MFSSVNSSSFEGCPTMPSEEIDLCFTHVPTDSLLGTWHSKVICWRDPGKLRAPRPSRGHPRTLACPLHLGLKQELALKISRQ